MLERLANERASDEEYCFTTSAGIPSGPGDLFMLRLAKNPFDAILESYTRTKVWNLLLKIKQFPKVTLIYSHFIIS